jgi:hypothetical protein
MPWYDYFNPSGWFGIGGVTPFPKTVDGAEASAVEAEPVEGEATGTQQNALSAAGAGAVGCSDFLGFGTPWAPCFGTWREMIRNPTLALVRRVVRSSILAGSWSVEADEDVPDDRKELIERCIVKRRQELLAYALTALDFECAPFEVLWKYDGALLIIERFKPLARALCTILALPSGEFAGIEQGAARGANGVTSGGVVKLLGAKSFLYANDPTPERPFGQSRLENCRVEVWRWDRIQDRLDRLTNKETGSATDVSFPPGSGKDSAGATVPNRTLAEQHAQNVAAGRAWMAHENALGALTPAQRQAAKPEVIAELLKIPLWETKNIQLGGNGEAIAALEDRIAALDAKIVRGYLRPERSVLEGQHGTKAEAGTHTDTGTTDSESIEADIVRALNCGPVDDLLRFNWGDDAVGTVRVVAHPLRDVQESIDIDLIKTLAAGAATADEVYRTFDVDQVFERRGISKRQTPLPPAAPATPPGGAQPVKGADGAAGKMNGDGLALSRLLFGDGDE